MRFYNFTDKIIIAFINDVDKKSWDEKKENLIISHSVITPVNQLMEINLFALLKKSNEVDHNKNTDGYYLTQVQRLFVFASWHNIPHIESCASIVS